MSKQQQQQTTPRNIIFKLQKTKQRKSWKKYRIKTPYLERNTGGPCRESCSICQSESCQKPDRMARPLATSTVQWRYSKPSCWSDPDRHPHCMRLSSLQWEHPSPHSVRERAVSDSVAAVPHSCLLVLDRRRHQVCWSGPFMVQDRGSPTPGI